MMYIVIMEEENKETQKKWGGWRHGAGRPKKPKDKKYVSVCLTLQSRYQADALKREAEKLGVSVSKMIIKDYNLEFLGNKLEEMEKFRQEYLAEKGREGETK